MSDSDYQYDSYDNQPGGGEGQFEEAYREVLEPFWAQQKQEISQASTDLAEYKTQQLPLARIKKIMKSDEDVRMISAEAPVLFAKACELFILDLTMRGWVHAEDSRRRTLQRSDIAACIAHWEVLDFLADVIPLEEGKPEGAEGSEPPAGPSAAAAASGGGGGDMAVPQMYYGAPLPAAGMYQHHQQQQAGAVVPDMQQHLQQVPSPVMPPLGAAAQPPVAAALYQQWSNEGQQRRGQR